MYPWLSRIVIVSSTVGCTWHTLPASEEQTLKDRDTAMRHDFAWRLAASKSGPTTTPTPAAAAHHAQRKERTPQKPGVQQRGVASWYGRRQNGKKTASGERFDANKPTAAHRTLPLGSKAKITNLETGQSTDVTINDRGPYVKGRSIDLSGSAANKIGMKKKGLAPVKIEASPRPQPTGSPTPQPAKHE